MTGTNQAAWLSALLLVLTLAAAAAFWPSLQAEFVSDDRNAIVWNEHVTGPFDPVAIFTGFSWWGSSRADSRGYRPLATLSFAVNHLLGGLDVGGYHIVNIALHALVSWLLALTAIALGLTMAEAVTAAMVFALMPIHTEAVAWVVGRAELMAAAGYLGALICILAYRRSGRAWQLCGASLCLLAGLLCKENAATILAAPCILAACMPVKPLRRDVLALAALAAALFIGLALRAKAGPLMVAAGGDLLDNPLAGLPASTRCLGAISVMGRYLALSLWPRPLSVDYSYDSLAIGEGFIADTHSLLALGAVAIAFWAGWRRRKTTPAVTVALLLAASAYSMVSNLIVPIGTIMGERLFYLPSAGLCLAVSPFVLRLIRSHAPWGWILVAAATLAWTYVDVERSHQWRTPVTLFEAAAEAYPRSARAHMELASAYGRRGRSEEAIEHFRRSIAIIPDYAAAHYNMGNLLARTGRYPEAVAAYRSAVEHSPGLEQAWYNLGLTLQLQGRTSESRHALERAYQLRGETKVANPISGR